MSEQEFPNSENIEKSEVRQAPLDERARYQKAKERDVEKIKAQMEEAQKNTKKTRRTYWIKTGLLLVLIGISIALLFTITNYITPDSAKGFEAMIRGVNVPLFFALLGTIVLYILFETAKYSYLLKISTGKFRFRNSMKVMFLGKYYDGITPLSTGGQPFQIYYLHKKDIPAGVATAVPLVKFVINTFALGLLAIIFFSFAPGIFKESGNVVTTAILVIAWISMVANMLIPVVIVTFSLFPRFGKRCIIWIVWLLFKMHIVKNRYAATKKYVHEISEYRQSLKAIIRRWWLIIPLFLICLVGMAISFSIPFFVVVSIANVPPTLELLIQIEALSMISYYSASLIPTPGSSGAVETTSSLVFATALASNPSVGPVIGWVILVWRILTYYIYIFSGIGINIFEIIRSAVRNKRAKKLSQQ